MPRHHDRSTSALRDCRFRSRRRLVFSAWPRPFDPGYRSRGMPVPPGIRQRLFLRIRHFQHYRLIGHTPAEELAKNFGVPAETFAKFPKREVYIAQGPVPPPLAVDPGPGTINPGALTHRYRLLAQRPDTFAGGTLRLVSEREFPISTTMTGALMRIKPGGLRELHWHPNADEWQYYLSGRARMGVFGSHGRVRNEEF